MVWWKSISVFENDSKSLNFETLGCEASYIYFNFRAKTNIIFGAKIQMRHFWVIFKHWIQQGFATLWRCWWFVAGQFLNKGISSSTTKRFSRFYISNTWKLARLLLKGHHLNSLWVRCILKLAWTQCLKIAKIWFFVYIFNFSNIWFGGK